ncbi:hypothetical protein ACFE33_09990 [Falsihalocynthiibacter sp. SS001]|uniref:hypothetical protein n=1 Tax=Falsihalocynthiibacter sp. SS001 TaxID=3349698 RepID=UPI0036D30F99
MMSNAILSKFITPVAMSAGIVFALCGPSLAQATTDTADTDTILADTSANAEVTGFRSAEFGMDEESVLAAIKSDFGIEADSVLSGENNVERTRVLTVSIPDVLEGGGTAKVSYIFGYKSKGLIQVGISWGADTDPNMTDALLVANGDVLRSHFIAQGYDPETISVNTPLDTGILLFRGSDSEGRSSILLLQGSFEDSGEGQKTLLPQSLALLYSLNPDNPDVFKVESGSF